MKKVDMSSEAITERLKMASELRERCILLKKTKKISMEEAKEIVNAEYFRSLLKPKKNAKN